MLPVICHSVKHGYSEQDYNELMLTVQSLPFSLVLRSIIQLLNVMGSIYNESKPFIPLPLL